MLKRLIHTIQSNQQMRVSARVASQLNDADFSTLGTSRAAYLAGIRTSVAPPPSAPAKRPELVAATA